MKVVEARQAFRVIVTGGRGFVGRHVVQALTTRGYDAVSFDLQDGQDICDAAAVEAAIRGASAVVHLAAWADLYAAKVDPTEAVRVNVLGTTVVANACRRESARLIHGSTACVYGNQAFYPSTEAAVPNPTEIYAQSKLAAEQVIQGLVASFGMDAVIVRFPGVYGAQLRSALAVARFFERAFAGGVLEIHGDGLQTRTPIYVHDLVRGLVALVGQRDVQGVLNLGTSEEISALELAQRIIRLVGRGSISHGPQRLPQTYREHVDWRRANAMLGWSPHVSLDDGLARTRDWWVSAEARPLDHIGSNRAATLGGRLVCTTD